MLEELLSDITLNISTQRKIINSTAGFREICNYIIFNLKTYNGELFNVEDDGVKLLY